MESIKLSEVMDAIEFSFWKKVRNQLKFAPESFFDIPDLELIFVGIRDKYYET